MNKTVLLVALIKNLKKEVSYTVQTEDLGNGILISNENSVLIKDQIYIEVRKENIKVPN